MRSEAVRTWHGRSAEVGQASIGAGKWSPRHSNWAVVVAGSRWAAGSMRAAQRGSGVAERGLSAARHSCRRGAASRARGRRMAERARGRGRQGVCANADG